MNYETVENDTTREEERMNPDWNNEQMMNDQTCWTGIEVEPRKPDKYDLAIDYLTQNPEQIRDAWGNPEDYEGRGGELFGFVGPDWKSNDNKVRYDGVHGTCGCLQQIRAAKVNGKHENMAEALDGDQMTGSYWPRLWDKIANDRNLPHDEDDITVEDLPVFAEWQREIDALRLADGFHVA